MKSSNVATNEVSWISSTKTMQARPSV